MDKNRTAASMVEVPLRRIGPGYEQIAEQLREAISSGTLPRGTRLPTENQLAAQLGMSRATVREALRALSAEGLISTTKGPTGGSFVSAPSLGRLTEQYRLGFSLLAQDDGIKMDDFHELRVALEVPASRLAALRRTNEELETLGLTLPNGSKTISSERGYKSSANFHDLVLALAHNRLLTMAAEPVFSVLQLRLDRSKLTPTYHKTVASHHNELYEAIAAQDEEAAANLMREHLDWVRPRYERAWTSPGQSA